MELEWNWNDTMICQRHNKDFARLIINPAIHIAGTLHIANYTVILNCWKKTRQEMLQLPKLLQANYVKILQVITIQADSATQIAGTSRISRQEKTQSNFLAYHDRTRTHLGLGRVLQTA